MNAHDDAFDAGRDAAAEYLTANDTDVETMLNDLDETRRRVIRDLAGWSSSGSVWEEFDRGAREYHHSWATLDRPVYAVKTDKETQGRPHFDLYRNGELIGSTWLETAKAIHGSLLVVADPDGGGCHQAECPAA